MVLLAGVSQDMRVEMKKNLCIRRNCAGAAQRLGAEVDFWIVGRRDGAIVRLLKKTSKQVSNSTVGEYASTYARGSQDTVVSEASFAGATQHVGAKIDCLTPSLCVFMCGCK